MTESEFDLEDISRLIRLVETRGLEELIVEEEGRRIVIRGASHPKRRASVVLAHAPIPAEAAPPVPTAPALLPATLPADAPADLPPADRIAIESPMVGVFYHAAHPDQPPFVEVGDRVEIGQTIGIIEAMKVFSEIPCEHAGVVVEIAAQNGQLVRQGEPLLWLRAES